MDFLRNFLWSLATFICCYIIKQKHSNLMTVTHSYLPENTRKWNTGQSRENVKNEFHLSWMVSRIVPENILLSVAPFSCFCSMTTLSIIKESIERSLKIAIWSYISIAWLIKLFRSLSRMLWCFEVHRLFSNYQQFYSCWTSSSSEVTKNWSSQIILPRFTSWVRDIYHWEMILCRCTVMQQFS